MAVSRSSRTSLGQSSAVQEAGVNFRTLRVDVVDVTTTESSRQENKEKEKEKEKKGRIMSEQAALLADQVLLRSSALSLLAGEFELVN